MAQSSQIFWAVAAVAATLAYGWWRRPGPQVADVGEAEHHFEPHQNQNEIENENENENQNQNVNLNEVAEDGAEAGDIGARWDNDDRARRALEEFQAGQEPERVNAWKQRGEVGTKKAKSLAKRDQRRAYYEYVRQQAEDQRKRLDMYEEAFGDLIAKEREERQRNIDAAKAEIEEFNAKRRQLEEEDRLERRERRERIARDLRESGRAKLDDEDGIDVEIAESITGAIVLENEEYAVTASAGVVQALASQLNVQGRLTFDEIRAGLERVY